MYTWRTLLLACALALCTTHTRAQVDDTQCTMTFAEVVKSFCSEPNQDGVSWPIYLCPEGCREAFARIAPACTSEGARLVDAIVAAVNNDTSVYATTADVV